MGGQCRLRIPVEGDFLLGLVMIRHTTRLQETLLVLLYIGPPLPCVLLGVQPRFITAPTSGD